LTYQFPFNSSIEAEGTIYLASNSTVFQNKYGMTPFGQFTRNLSTNLKKLFWLMPMEIQLIQSSILTLANIS
jgi:hypothetical protein